MLTSTNTGEPAPPPNTPPDELVPGDQVNPSAVAAMAEVGLIWIREDGANGIGARRVLDVREYRIHRHDPPAVPAAQ